MCGRPSPETVCTGSLAATCTLPLLVRAVSPSETTRDADGLFDAKHLAERPHPEQAYAIATVAGHDGLTVYVAANDTPGLYYGLLTLGQLLDGLSDGSDLVLPHGRIVDWPDVRGRGTWVMSVGCDCS